MTDIEIGTVEIEISSSEFTGSVEVSLAGERGATGPQGPQGLPGIGSGGVGIPAGGSTGQKLTKSSGADYDVQWENDPPATGPTQRLAFFDQTTGELVGFDEMQYNPARKSLSFFHEIEPEANTDYVPLNLFTLSLNPQVPNVRQNWQYSFTEVNVGTDGGTNPMGDATNGSVQLDVRSFRCDQKASVGNVFIYGAYGTLGNGTDPVTSENFTVYGGNSNIADGASVKNFEIFNYGVGGVGALVRENFRGFNIGGNFGDVTGDVGVFQSGINFKDVGQFVNSFVAFNNFDNIRGMNAFADFQQVFVSVDSSGSYISFTSQPQIEETRFFTGLNIGPTIDLVTQNADGINVNMDNVTVYAGVQASLVVQDLTYQFVSPGSFYNGFQIQYVDDVSAGAEYVSLSGQLLTVHIESGVTTADQVKSAVQGNFSVNASITVTGGGSNPQTSFGPTNFTGGIDAGLKRAAYFKGNVQIDGALSFSGNLSIGALSGFAPLSLVDGGGTPASAHTLISSPNCPANSTIANADTLGVNTAALIQIGDNSTITTAFLGVAALGLPAVLSVGAGSTVDRVAGAVFALSLDAAAGAGGIVDTVALCRALSLPNATTTVNRLYGYEFSLPFGDVGTDIWGFYNTVASSQNFIAGSVKIGGSDKVSSDNVALEIESTSKAFRLSRMSTAARDAMSPLEGMVIFNTTTSALEYYDGSAWV